MTSTGTTETLVGQRVEALDTPALWVDLDALEQNVAAVVGFGSLRAGALAGRPLDRPCGG